MALQDLNVKFNADTTSLMRGFKQASSGLSSLAKTAAQLAGITLGVKALADSFKAFTALESNMSRVGSIFGGATQNIQAFAQGSAKAFGMAESSVYQYASIYGNLFKNITADTVENSAVTIQMLQASAVVASKTGRTMEDVMDRIRSGLLGSTEAIEDLGINVNISMLEMTDAFKRIADGRSWNQLNFYEQQQIRTLGILEQAHKNFGDEVQGGTAFSLATLSSAFKDLMATAGSFVNAVLSPIIQALTSIVRLATAALKALAALLGINATIDIGGGLEAGGAGAGEIADGLGDAAKNAKKLNQQLAGFDELNDMTKSAPSGGAGAASAIGGGAGGMGITMDFEQLQPPDTTWTDTLTKGLQGIKDLLEPTRRAFSDLWGVLKEIGGFVWTGVKDFYNTFLVPVAKWAFGEGIPRLVDALRNGLEKVNFSKIGTAFNGLWEALKPFAINVGEGLVWFWENVLVPLGTWTMNNAVPAFLDILSSVIGGLNEIVEALKPLATWLWENFLQPLAEWTGGVIVDALSGINDALKQFSDWAKDNHKTIENAAIVIGSLATAFGLVNIAVGLWKAIGAAATAVTAAFGVAINGTLLPVLLVSAAIGALIAVVVLLIRNWDEIKEKAIAVWESIQLAWSAAGEWFNTTVVEPVKTFFSGLWEGIKTAASGAWENVKTTWQGVKDWFSDTIINPVRDAFSLACDNIGGFFTDLWDGIKNTFSQIGEWFQENVADVVSGTFKGLVNNILGGLEAFLNNAVSAINKLIASINSALSIVGVSIRPLQSVQLPRLAKGGVAFGEVQAIVGDNFNARQDPEVISPLSTLHDMILGAMVQHSVAGGGSQDIRINMMLQNGDVLADIMVDPMNKTAKNMGFNPVFSPA